MEAPAESQARVPAPTGRPRPRQPRPRLRWATPQTLPLDEPSHQDQRDCLQRDQGDWLGPLNQRDWLDQPNQQDQRDLRDQRDRLGWLQATPLPLGDRAGT